MIALLAAALGLAGLLGGIIVFTLTMLKRTSARADELSTRFLDEKIAHEITKGELSDAKERVRILDDVVAEKERTIDAERKARKRAQDHTLELLQYIKSNPGMAGSLRDRLQRELELLSQLSTAREAPGDRASGQGDGAVHGGPPAVPDPAAPPKPPTGTGGTGTPAGP